MKPAQGPGPGGAVLSASDRSCRGEREDLSGRLLCRLVEEASFPVVEYLLVPDSIGRVRMALRRLSGRRDVNFVLTTGGTGVAPRDVTPDATAPLLERDLPALSLAVRWESYRKARASVLSRAVAGFRGDCLIINMPGSPRAVEECFEVIRPTLQHLFGAHGKDGDDLCQ